MPLRNEIIWGINFCRAYLGYKISAGVHLSARSFLSSCLLLPSIISGVNVIVESSSRKMWSGKRFSTRLRMVLEPVYVGGVVLIILWVILEFCNLGGLLSLCLNLHN